MKTKIPLKATIAIVLVFSVSSAVITAYFCKNERISLDPALIKKLSAITETVDENYYFSYDKTELENKTAKGYVDGIGDKYAAYFYGDESKKQSEKLSGDSYGIGMLCVNTPDDNIYVWRVYDGSPAKIAGLKTGDIITEIDKKSVSKIGYKKAIKLLTNKKSIKASLTVMRNNKKFKVDIKLAQNDVQTVFSKKLNKRIGLIQITAFNDKSYLQFVAATDKLSCEGIKNYIIDLRHNGGGTVTSAAKILDYLMPECDLIRVKDKNGKIFVRNKSDKKYFDCKLKVLCDEKTASASEIFISCLKDYSRAEIIGATTFGKSAIQRSFDLYDGSRIKFTIAEYVNKDGKTYNKKGIKPDVDLSDIMPDSYSYYFMNENNDMVLKRAVKRFQPS